MSNDKYLMYFGTKNDWQDIKDKLPGAEKIEPVEVYVSKKGLCLITSRDEVNWLLNLSREMNGEID